MGVYSDYLNQSMPFDVMTAERKKQLKRISAIRKRPVIAFVSDCKNVQAGIDYSDVLPFWDQLSSLSGEAVDIILETPGGFAEVVEDLVKQIRRRFNNVGVIIPGMAKSAGTIFAMAADEILMGEISALGPIDAQIAKNGNRFSADAFLEGLKKIREECQTSGKLDLAFIPILQSISPGEIQHCQNAQAFSADLVTRWLIEYKFKFWNKHSSTGLPVTDEEKVAKAAEIAGILSNHGRWLTHGRSFGIEELSKMGLKITDFSKDPDLGDAIMRYYTLMRMGFETTIYKMYETENSQIYRHCAPAQIPLPKPQKTNEVMIDLTCHKCNTTHRMRVLFEGDPKKSEIPTFPKDNKWVCPVCGTQSDLLGIRQQIEAQHRRRII